VTRYAARWGIEQAFADARNVPGAGEARNRVRSAVERTVPFALLAHTLIIIWYARHGHDPADIDDRRTAQPWYRTKTEPAFEDMLIKAAPDDDRRPFFAKPPWSARTRANPRRPRSLGSSRCISTKLQKPVTPTLRWPTWRLACPRAARPARAGDRGGLLSSGVTLHADDGADDQEHGRACVQDGKARPWGEGVGERRTVRMRSVLRIMTS